MTTPKKMAPMGRTPHKKYRLRPEDLRRIAWLRMRLGIRSDAEVIRYALAQTVEMAGGR